MRPKPMSLSLATALALCTASTSALAVPAQVTGGSASTTLTNSNPAGGGWTLIASSPGVTTSATAGTTFTATFPVNSRTAPARPTSATFDTADPLGTYAGTLELSGFLTFLFGNGQHLELGDFSLAFDSSRTGSLGGQASGFVLLNGRGAAGPSVAFDVASPTASAPPDATSFSFSGGLLASPELAQFLSPFAQPNYAGTSLGSLSISATAQPATTPPPAVPLPPAFYPALLTLAGAVAIPAVVTRRAGRRLAAT